MMIAISSQKQSLADEKLLFSVREVARVLGVCERTVWTMIKENGLPIVRLRGSVRIPKERLLQWIDQHTSALKP